jgi:putative transposase
MRVIWEGDEDMGDARRRRRRLEPTDEWEQLELLCRWPEQLAYEEIRPLVFFGLPVVERAEETSSSERTLYRRIARCEAEGMDSLFATEGTKRRALPPAMRRFVVDLKAEHPPMRPHEISTVCYVRFGRRSDCGTVPEDLGRGAGALAHCPPLRPPYHEMGEPRERRTAVVRACLVRDRVGPGGAKPASLWGRQAVFTGWFPQFSKRFYPKRAI